MGKCAKSCSAVQCSSCYINVTTAFPQVPVRNFMAGVICTAQVPVDIPSYVFQSTCCNHPDSPLVLFFMLCNHEFMSCQSEVLKTDALKHVCSFPLRLGVLLLSSVIDRIFYGRWVNIHYNFLQFNVLSGLSGFYGTHPWHFYLTQGLPVVLATHLLILLVAFKKRKEPLFLSVVAWSIAIYRYVVWVDCICFIILRIADTIFRFLIMTTSIVIVFGFFGNRMCITNTFLTIFGNTRYQYLSNCNFYDFLSTQISRDQEIVINNLLRFENCIFLSFMTFGINGRNHLLGNDQKCVLLLSSEKVACLIGNCLQS